MNALQLLNTHLGRAAIGGLVGGGGALIYNQFTDNDINPLLAAGIGVGVGAVSPYIREIGEAAQDIIADAKATWYEKQNPIWFYKE